MAQASPSRSVQFSPEKTLWPPCAEGEVFDLNNAFAHECGPGGSNPAAPSASSIAASS